MRTLATRFLRLKVVRFGLVGLTNSAVDLVVFAAAVWFGGPPLAANFLGWLVAVVFSYFANSRWSFERDPRVGEARSALRFISLGALITLGVSSGAILSLGEIIGVMPAKIIGLIVAAVISFAAARWSIENRVL